MRLLLLSLLLVLGSCATGYHKQSLSGGYTDTQLAETIYKVRFNGNGYTSSVRVQSYLLRRYAELTIEKGYDYFVELNANDLSDLSVGSSWDNKSINVTSRHSSSGVIKLFKEGEQPDNAYNPYMILKKEKVDLSAKEEIVENTKLSEDNINKIQKKPMEVAHIGGYVGLAFYGSSFKVNDVDMNFSGLALSGGVRRVLSKHTVKVGAQYLKGDLNNASNSEFNVDVSSLNGVELSYSAVGLDSSYEYRVNDSFGIGGYFKYSVGTLKFCDGSGSCLESDASVGDYGVRADLHLAYWNPYIAFGGAFISEDGGPTRAGASAYLGLINFEF